MDIQAIAPIIEQIVKDSLNAKVYQYGKRQKSLTNRVASGKLKNSIKAQVQPNRQGITVVQLTAFGQPLNNTYAYWLINDRKGSGRFANITAIEQWIRDKKSFRIRDFKTGKFLPKNEKNIKNVAFVVARSIGRFGYKNKPQNFAEISIKEIINNKQIIEIIGEATIDDLLNVIESI